jgi:hypothetical protein
MEVAMDFVSAKILIIVLRALEGGHSFGRVADYLDACMKERRRVSLEDLKRWCADND